MNTLAYLCGMRLFPHFCRLWVRGSLHVSAALLSLLYFTELLTGRQVPGAYYGALFFGSVAGYNAIKYGTQPGKHRRVRGEWSRVIFWLSLACLLAAILFLLRLSLTFWLLSAACALLAALYALPVFPGFRNLRSYALLKVPLVAVVWTGATLWIPIWAGGGSLDRDLWVEGFQRLLWVSLLMLPFEIRDMGTDPPGMRTLPRRWGLRDTRRIAWAGALVFFASTVLKDHPGISELVSKGIAALLTGLAVQFSTEQQPRFYASFWVESVPLLATALFWAGLQFEAH